MRGASFLSRPPRVSPMLALTPLLAACTGTVSSQGGPGLDAETTVTHAVVLVERTVDSSEGTRAAASARFARVAAGASAGDTLRAIGASLELPAPGSCASVRHALGGSNGLGGETGTASADPVPVVELLDVGRVTVEAGGAMTSLVPRQLPYVTDVVTGTVYARAAEAAALPASAPYVVHVAGTRDIAAFDVAAFAPDDPSDVTIAQETSPGQVVSTGATVNFTLAQSSRSLAYVEVQPAGVRCALGDGGRASIPSSLLDDAGSLIVHRLHTEPLQVRGIDDGELRFDFARVVAYVRR
jgi:hypothetical protein